MEKETERTRSFVITINNHVDEDGCVVLHPAITYYHGKYIIGTILLENLQELLNLRDILITFTNQLKSPP